MDKPQTNTMAGELPCGTNLHYIISDHSHLVHMLNQINDSSTDSYAKYLRISKISNEHFKTKGGEPGNLIDTNGEYFDFKLYSMIGNAGTGKTQGICNIMQAFPRSILCASTNAAANSVNTRLRNCIGPGTKDAFIERTIHSLLGWNIDKYMLSVQTVKNLIAKYEKVMCLDDRAHKSTYDNLCISIMSDLAPTINHLLGEHQNKVNYSTKLTAFINSLNKKGHQTNCRGGSPKAFKNEKTFTVFENLENQEQFVFALETFCRVLLNVELSKLLLGNIFIVEEAGRVPAYMNHILINMWYHINHLYQTPQRKTKIPVIILVGSTSQSKVINFNCSMIEECQTVIKFHSENCGISLYTYNRRLASTCIMSKMISQVQIALEFGERITPEMEQSLECLVVKDSFYDPIFRPDAIRIVKKHSDAKKYVEKFHSLKKGNLVTIYEYVFVAGDIRSLNRKRAHSPEHSHNIKNDVREIRKNKISTLLKHRMGKRNLVQPAISGAAEDLLEQDELSYQFYHKSLITDHLRNNRNTINFTSNTISLNSLYIDIRDMNLAFTVEILPECVSSGSQEELEEESGDSLTYHMYKLTRELTENCSLIINHKTNFKLRGFCGSFKEFSTIVMQNRGELPHIFVLRVAFEYAEKYISCYDLDHSSSHVDFNNIISVDMESRFQNKTWLDVKNKLPSWKSTIDTFFHKSRNRQSVNEDDTPDYHSEFEFLWCEIKTALLSDNEFSIHKLKIEPQLCDGENYIRCRNSLPGDTNTCTFIKMVNFYFSKSRDLCWVDKEHLPDRCPQKVKSFCGMLWSELKKIKNFDMSIPSLRILVGGKFIADTIPELASINWKTVFPQGLFKYVNPVASDSNDIENEDETNPMVLSSQTEKACVIGLFSSCVENLAQTIDFSQGMTLDQPAYIDTDSLTSQRDLLVGLTRNVSADQIILSGNKFANLPPSEDLRNSALNIARDPNVYKIY